MKISFGLSHSKAQSGGPERPSRDTAKVASVFSATAEPPKAVKRSILEITNGSFREEGGPEEPPENDFVIPCKNSLHDLKPAAHTEEKRAPKRKLKFGLNVFGPTGAIPSSHSEPKVPPKEASTHSGDPFSHSGDPFSHSGDPFSHSGDPFSHSGDPFSHSGDPFSHSGDPSTGEDDHPKEALTGDDSKDPFSNSEDPPTHSEDAHAASLIIEETERAMMRDLFGITEESLAEKASKTVPILLRKNDSDGTEGQVDPKMYDKMPVENFGLAMLLGMGFDPKGDFKKPREYKKRVYERGGLGSDAAMKNNMDMLLNAKLMANVKSSADVTLFPGLLVKIIDKRSEHYRGKGVVERTCGNVVTLSLFSDGMVSKNVEIMSKYLETTVVAGTKCRVVRKIANRQGKEEIPVGALVDVLSLHDTSAKVSYNGNIMYTSMDNVCGFKVNK